MFDITSTTAIERIKTLVKENRLQGFFDDRGKFIYISDEDLKKISDYVISHGRCSLSELSYAFGEILKL